MNHAARREEATYGEDFSAERKAVSSDQAPSLERVEASKGEAGIDQQSIAEFEVNLGDNLYKIWNRMASKAIRETIRSWGLARMSPHTMEYIAGKINATVRGWIDYYGAFFKSELKRLFRSIDEHLIRWMMRKYKRFRGHWGRSWRWLNKYARQNSGLFVHWEFLYGPPLLNPKRLYGKSRMS